MKIYVASSWRNQYHPGVVKLLRELGHEVYDFRNPDGDTGFSWSQIDPNWQSWTPDEYVKALNHPTAQKGFTSDFRAMVWADVCLMVLPCGRSANTEAGWMKGAGKTVYVYQPIAQEPELMYKIYDHVIISEIELVKCFELNRVLPLDGLQLITQERKEQIFKHGRTVERDVEENFGYQLSDAASILCLFDRHTVEPDDCCPHGWDEKAWARMNDEKTYKQRLIIAGALTAAELDRLNETKTED